jgi:hypothetical protein
MHDTSRSSRNMSRRRRRRRRRPPLSHGGPKECKLIICRHSIGLCIVVICFNITIKNYASKTKQNKTKQTKQNKIKCVGVININKS